MTQDRRDTRDCHSCLSGALFRQLGGGVQGGNVIGSTDKIGAYPADKPQRPENMAATIYRALGIPSTAVWRNKLDRPYPIYHGDPIDGLV